MPKEDSQLSIPYEVEPYQIISVGFNVSTAKRAARIRASRSDGFFTAARAPIAMTLSCGVPSNIQGKSGSHRALGMQIMPLR